MLPLLVCLFVPTLLLECKLHMGREFLSVVFIDISQASRPVPGTQCLLNELYVSGDRRFLHLDSTGFVVHV